MIYGRGGADTIDGYLGDDEIFSGGGADIVNGGQGNDTINGGGGADVINGDEGDDVINAGNGADIVNGGQGNDTINGGGGTDVISGGDGLDELYGNAGSDTFVFESLTAYNNRDNINDFSLADGDAIDISDLLTGYNSGVDNITDFVRISNNAGNSIVEVDMTGSRNFSGSTNEVAYIIGVTGLTDEASLEASGALIV